MRRVYPAAPRETDRADAVRCCSSSSCSPAGSLVAVSLRKVPAANVASPAPIEPRRSAVEASVERHSRLRRSSRRGWIRRVATGLALSIALVVAVVGGVVLAVLAYLVRGERTSSGASTTAPRDWGHAHATRVLDPRPRTP